MRFFSGLFLTLSMLVAAPVLAAEKSIIVLDASGSMWGQIDGKAKMSIARDTLDTVLKAVPAGNKLGLMVYGHREKGSCADIELAVPPAAGTADAISRFVHGINPKGKTPLTASVRQAAEALKYTEEKATVILITDGLETCEADPCALATELEKQGVDFTAHVVGFGLTAEEGKQVACLAENTGGQYFQASDAPQLVEAMTAAIVEAPKPVVEEPAPAPAAVPAFNVEVDAVLSEGGPSLGDSNEVQWKLFKADAAGKPAGDYLQLEYKGHFSTTLEPGAYVAEAKLNNSITAEVPFTVTAGAVAKPFVNFNAAYLIVTPKRTPQDAAADDSARVDVKFGAFTPTFYGVTKLYVAAGPVALTGSLGAVVVEDSLTAKAGETIEKDLVIGSGVLVTKALYADGGPEVDSSEIFFELVSPTQDINGERKNFGYVYGTGKTLDTPTGNLLLTAKLGSARGEMPFAIAAGERKEVTVNIDAGVLAVTAPAADSITVVAAKKDIQGNQKDISMAYGAEHKDTLPPGDYLVRVKYADDLPPKEKPVTIKAGERSEVTVE